MHETISCPFCNAMVPVPTTIPQSRRILCVRCGETFPLRNSSNTTRAKRPDILGISYEQALLQRRQEQRPKKAFLSLRTTLIVMLLMGVIGFGIGLRYAFRSDLVSTSEIETENKTRSPLQLSAIGYLPKDIESLVTIDIQRFLETLPSASTDIDFRTALEQRGIRESWLRQLESITGFDLRSVDHLVIGVGKWNQLPPKIVLVLQSKQSIPIDNLVEKTRSKPIRQKERTFYSFRPTGQKLLDVVWFTPNQKYWIFSLSPTDLETVPTERQSGVDHLTSNLVEQIQQKVPTDAMVSLFLDTENWGDLFKPFLAIPKGKLESNLLDAFQQNQSLLGHLRWEEQKPMLSVWLKRKNADEAQRFRSSMLDKFQAQQGQIQVGGSQTECFLRLEMKADLIQTLFTKLFPE